MLPFLILGLIALAAVVGLAQIFVRTEPRQLMRGLRYATGGIMAVAGIVLAIGGRWGLGLPLAFVGVSTLVTGRLGPIDFVGTEPAGGGGSRVRSAYLEMRLDHDTGAVNGRVTAGRFAGRDLDDLDEEGLQALLADIAGDRDSVALFEAYLDRRQPGWREHVDRDQAAGAGGATGTRTMGHEEAYEVLGLATGASEAEIRAAHRRLMKRLHPDQGGSTFLAAKLNEAKDRLLGKHR